MPDLNIGLWAILCLALISTSVRAADNAVNVEREQSTGAPATETMPARRAEGKPHIKGLVASPSRLGVPIQIPADTGGEISANEQERNRDTAAP